MSRWGAIRDMGLGYSFATLLGCIYYYLWRRKPS